MLAWSQRYNWSRSSCSRSAIRDALSRPAISTETGRRSFARRVVHFRERAARATSSRRVRIPAARSSYLTPSTSSSGCSSKKKNGRCWCSSSITSKRNRRATERSNFRFDQADPLRQAGWPDRRQLESDVHLVEERHGFGAPAILSPADRTGDKIAGATHQLTGSARNVSPAPPGRRDISLRELPEKLPAGWSSRAPA